MLTVVWSIEYTASGVRELVPIATKGDPLLGPERYVDQLFLPTLIEEQTVLDVFERTPCPELESVKARLPEADNPRIASPPTYKPSSLSAPSSELSVFSGNIIRMTWPSANPASISLSLPSSGRNARPEISCSAFGVSMAFECATPLSIT